jgi:hypothetical protein
MGTTNSTAYLKDRTGNRRWWPIAVKVRQIDTEKLAANADQIWAEAVHLYWELRKKYPKDKLPLYLQSEEARAKALALQEEFREESFEDSMAAEIEEWVNTTQPLSLLLGEVTHEAPVGGDDPMVVPVELCLAEIWEKALGQEPSRYLSDKRNGNTLAQAMRELKDDWSRSPAKRPTRSHGRQRTYYRLDANGQEREQGYRIVDLSAGAKFLEDLI